MDFKALRQQLADARAALIAALEGASESDYHAQLGSDQTVVAALAALARQERATIEEARRVAGAPPRPSPVVHGEPPRRLTPPPVVHDLAGARHEALLLVETLAAPDGALPASGIEAAAALLQGLIEAERDLAARIAAHVKQNPKTPPAA